MAKTFKCYSIEPNSVPLKERLTALESELDAARNNLELGYMTPAGFQPASSVLLRTKMRADPDESVRRACFEGMCAVGPAVLPRLCEAVKLRSELAKLQGYATFYDMKVTASEGFSEAVLFAMLDALEERTRPLMEAARARLAAEKGEAALLPWNMGQALAGETTLKLDPYFPFEQAVDMWARSFAALGITYARATMNLDLLDRPRKYSNGFCHWPQCAYVKSDGMRVPSTANFTSLATPSAPGSGHSALETLMHEGGHAAHFANCVVPSPFFSQERAPTSVAYAETQSMLLDSLVGDAAWVSRYARDRAGSPMPASLHEEHMRATKPYDVLSLRAMLAVPFFERALYSLPLEEVTPARVAALAAEVELKLQGGPASRPLLTVPHILSDESSCYYHGYVLAEMAVHQTREHLVSLFGRIVDEPRVGPAIAAAYWAPGNGQPFLKLVQAFTGAPLSSDAWVAHLNEPLEEAVRREAAEYAAGLVAGPARAAGSGADLDMRVRLVDGESLIADSGEPGGEDACERLAAATAAFATWVRGTVV